MDFCQQLALIARRIESRSDRELPYPCEQVGPYPPVGSSPFPTRLLYGACSQFLLWKDEILLNALRLFCGYRDDACRRAHAGLADVLGELYSVAPANPALAFLSPVWINTQNWIESARLKPQDRTVATEPHELGSSGDALHTLTFSSLNTINVPLKELAFFYHDPRVTTVLYVPRERNLVDPFGHRWEAYEEGLGLGDVREQQALKKGDYTPNKLRYHQLNDTRYLDFPTVTFARLSPFRLRPTAGFRWRHVPRNRFSWQATIDRLPFGFASEPEEDPGEPPAGSAMVEFVRLTFEPDSMRIVVFLAAERDFDRFLSEHAGLGELLNLAFAEPSS